MSQKDYLASRGYTFFLEKDKCDVQEVQFTENELISGHMRGKVMASDFKPKAETQAEAQLWKGTVIVEAEKP